MDFGNSRDIGCSPSQNTCCSIDAYVDREFHIHVLILNHDGNNYDVVIQSAKTENEAEDIVVKQLTGAGLEVQVTN